MWLFADCTLADTQKNCSCMTGYTWSEDSCRNHACCKNENCEINVDDPAFCLSEKRGRVLFDLGKGCLSDFLNVY